MCESKVDPSKVRGVYEEWGWLSVKGNIGCRRMNPIQTTRMRVYTKWVQTRASPSESNQGEVRLLQRGESSSELR